MIEDDEDDLDDVDPWVRGVSLVTVRRALLTISPIKTIKRRLEEHQKRTQSHSFILDYQQAQKSAENVICHKALAPITIKKYETFIERYPNLPSFKISRGQINKKAKLSKNTPLPKTQELKNFVESFITSRKDLPYQNSTLTIFNHFISK
ncbi:unnamed protein product [Penicillium salamii]|uniref:Uncharacterized protein n=1 Tax=Penicillium salamii TaxID=1612424 RepID=A0A9W4K0R8_9EURO|nr:unnamed protein product [Penicillium salamii]CAG8112216.1 unnamed protein product [Penicillium salamii]CAG8145174.1 unnamed protein product [Penicillium salamii]CAG8172530.1 unnamed protein product [Penicillium salamii]CAG8342949.1 unnamed protein product [Penicillium salamii]